MWSGNSFLARGIERLSWWRGYANGLQEQKGWYSCGHSERLTGALLDRLTHHVKILEMNVDSYRLNQTNAKQK